jgi:hypothetical protein
VAVSIEQGLEILYRVPLRSQHRFNVIREVSSGQDEGMIQYWSLI